MFSIDKYLTTAKPTLKDYRKFLGNVIDFENDIIIGNTVTNRDDFYMAFSEMLKKSISLLLNSTCTSAELSSSCWDYFLTHQEDEDTDDDDILLTSEFSGDDFFPPWAGNQLRYKLQSTGKNKWHYLKENIVVTVSKYLNEDLYNSDVAAWVIDCDNKRELFLNDILEYYKIEKSLYTFLVSNSKVNSSSDFDYYMSYVVNLIEEYKKAIK